MITELFQSLQTLINEHGSATILKERLGLIAAQYATLERRCSDLEAEKTALQDDLKQITIRHHELEARMQALVERMVCDHCGSPDLVRTGSRPMRHFGQFGDKLAIYTCQACGRSSEFAID